MSIRTIMNQVLEGCVMGLVIVLTLAIVKPTWSLDFSLSCLDGYFARDAFENPEDEEDEGVMPGLSLSQDAIAQLPISTGEERDEFVDELWSWLLDPAHDDEVIGLPLQDQIEAFAMIKDTLNEGTVASGEDYEHSTDRLLDILQGVRKEETV